MLAKITPMTSDFYALARYLVNGKGGKPHPDRVAWTKAHNLFVDDPELVAKIMEATASLSARTKHPAYHMIIAWHPEEEPSPEVMQEIAVQTLEMAGLGAYQALIMGHGDTEHPHLHMMINRVHPDTGKAWKASHDYALFDRIMRTLSDDHGFRYSPAHRYNLDDTDHLTKKPNSKATYAAKRGANTNRSQWPKTKARAFGERLSEQLDAASTWDDLSTIVADHGLTLEEKGQGYVVGNDTSYTKLSSLGLQKSAHGFTKHKLRRKKPPALFDTPAHSKRRPLFTVDEVDLARVFVSMGLVEQNAVRLAVEDAVAARQERAGDVKLVHTMIHRACATTTLAQTARTKAARSASKRPATKRASLHGKTR